MNQTTRMTRMTGWQEASQTIDRMVYLEEEVSIMPGCWQGRQGAVWHGLAALIQHLNISQVLVVRTPAQN